MKRINLSAVLTAMVCGLTCTTANAKCWRVNHDTNTGAHFASINAAMAADSGVEAGDTLYLDPGLVTSAAATISKRVTIIGTGYLRASSPHKFAIVSHTLTITAEGTKIEGLRCWKLILNAANVTIERCYLTGEINSSSDKCETFTGITIRQSYIKYAASGSASSDCHYAIKGYSTGHRFTNAIIENNIIVLSGDYAYSPIRYLNSCIIRNNYIKYMGKSSNYVLQDVSNSSIYNNVLLNSKTIDQVNSNVGNQPHHNIYSAAPATSGDESAEPIVVNGNNNYLLGSADENLIFAMSGNNDERFSELKENSPAKGFGVDGADCGPSGGLYPYVVSGLPAYHPYYTNAVFSKTSDGTGINVSLKIKMQNE